MLSQINNSFTILAKSPPATAEQLDSLTNHFERVPQEYLHLISEATDIELGHANGQYIRILGPLGCTEMDEANELRVSIPDAVPIGDDGGGHVIFYATGKQGTGLYHVGLGNLDMGNAIWIAPSLVIFLTKSEGIESF